jgi:hypothetical protein
VLRGNARIRAADGLGQLDQGACHIEEHGS